MSLNDLPNANWIDVLSLIILLRISYVGSMLGVGSQILPFVSLSLIYFTTLYYYNSLAVLVARYINVSDDTG